MEWACLGTDREGTLLLHSAKIRAGLEDPGSCEEYMSIPHLQLSL